MPSKKVSKTKASKAVKNAKPKSKKTKAVKNVVAASPVAPTAPVDTKVVAPAVETVVPSLGDAFGELLGQLTALRSQLTSVTGQVRALQKRADRELKNAHKASKSVRSVVAIVPPVDLLSLPRSAWSSQISLERKRVPRWLAQR